MSILLVRRLSNNRKGVATIFALVLLALFKRPNQSFAKDQSIMLQK